LQDIDCKVHIWHHSDFSLGIIRFRNQLIIKLHNGFYTTILLRFMLFWFPN
jgi:hypothetical protein